MTLLLLLLPPGREHFERTGVFRRAKATPGDTGQDDDGGTALALELLITCVRPGGGGGTHWAEDAPGSCSSGAFLLGTPTACLGLPFCTHTGWAAFRCGL